MISLLSKDPKTSFAVSKEVKSVQQEWMELDVDKRRAKHVADKGEFDWVWQGPPNPTPLLRADLTAPVHVDLH